MFGGALRQPTPCITETISRPSTRIAAGEDVRNPHWRSCPNSESAQTPAKSCTVSAGASPPAPRSTGSSSARSCGRRRPEPTQLFRVWVPVNGPRSRRRRRATACRSMGSEPARSCGRRRPEHTQFGHLRVSTCAPRARARRRAWVSLLMTRTSTSARARALTASRCAASQSTTSTPESAQTTAKCGQRGFAPPNGGAFAAAEGDPACGVAERLTRKGWPLAANPWRALRKCNVGICL